MINNTLVCKIYVIRIIISAQQKEIKIKDQCYWAGCDLHGGVSCCC